MTGPEPAVLSPRNPRVASLRRLSGRRSARAEAGRFVIDGPRLVRDALDAGVVVESVFVPEGAVADDPAVDALLARCAAAGVEVFALAREVFDNVAPSTTPQPALAVAVPPRHPSVEEVAALDALFVLVDVADPGNAGTLVRVAEAAGIGAVVACGSGVEWWNPKVVRASAGSLFRVPVCAVDDPVALLGLLHRHGHTTAATVVEGSVPYTDLDCRGATTFVLGSEAHGLAAEVAAACTARVHIPMAGSVESLNVAMAGAVCAFELARQRRAEG
jgi:TrmH family RNA methyltransferase